MPHHHSLYWYIQAGALTILFHCSIRQLSGTICDMTNGSCTQCHTSFAVECPLAQRDSVQDPMLVMKLCTPSANGAGWALQAKKANLSLGYVLILLKMNCFSFQDEEVSNVTIVLETRIVLEI